MEEKTNNKKQKKDDCPFCNVSKETIERLTEKERAKKEIKTESKKKSSLKIKAGILTLIFILGLFVIVYVFSQEQENNSQKLQTAEPQEVDPQEIVFASNFSTQDVFGKEFVLSDFRNKKPVLLVFWATWCGFCAQELPDLKDFTQKYQNEIQVLVIPSGETKETIKEYIEEQNITFSMPLDENREIWNSYLVRGTPSHFLIDKKGEIVTLFPGLASADNLETMFGMIVE